MSMEQANTSDLQTASLRSDAVPATGLTEAEARARLQRDGPNEVPERRVHPLARFVRKFWGLSAWMLELIAVLSLLLHRRADFWIAVSLLFVNAVVSFLQEQKASGAVASLRRQLQVTARVRRDGIWKALAARELVVGDTVRIRLGDLVPADARIIEGELRIDQSALTGESRELRRAQDEVLYSGSIVRRGEASAVVTATGVRTYFGRTTELVQSARPKLHIEDVTTRLVKWLFIIVGTMVAISLALSLARGMPLLDILPLSLVLLMGAVPVAFPVMFTVSTALGSMELGRRGVLITRLAAVEDAANVDVLCADKTGTLTMNRLSLSGLQVQAGVTEDDVVRAGSLASNEANHDPIDAAFLRAAKERNLLDSDARLISFTPFSPETRRTETVAEIAGRRIRAMKGALRTVAELAALPADALAALEARADEAAQRGSRVIAVARGEVDGPVRLLGLAFLDDAPRPDSRELIGELRSLGIEVKMLTGDAVPVARGVATQLGLGEIVSAPDLRTLQRENPAFAAELIAGSHGFAEVFPEDKFVVVESLQATGHVVAMTGDGINDAPALRQAEVGIAVSGATDVAKAAASVVLTTDGLAGIVNLVGVGRAIYQRLLTWIINKLSRTILKAGFVVIAFIATGRFVISALGMILLVFMTDFVKIALSTDRVRPSQNPESWDIGPLVKIAVILGILMLAETLGLLAIAWQRFDLGDGRLEMFSFLTLLFFALFSIVSIRERRAFWASRPGWALIAALCADALAGLVVSRTGLGELRPLPLGQTAVVFAWSFVWALLVNDIIKTALIARLWSGRSHNKAPPPQQRHQRA